MSKKQIGTTVAVVVALAVVIYFLGGGFSGINPTTSVPSSTSGQQLVVQDQVVGTGAIAQPGDEVVVNYTGKLDNGTVFDTSVGKPVLEIVPCPAGTQTGLCFTLGAGQVIPGWDQGVQGMRVGGKRVLIIPPGLAYGAQAINNPQTGEAIIPANSTLTFEVELTNVVPAASSTQVAPEGPAAN